MAVRAVLTGVCALPISNARGLATTHEWSWPVLSCDVDVVQTNGRMLQLESSASFFLLNLPAIVWGGMDDDSAQAAAGLVCTRASAGENDYHHSSNAPAMLPMWYPEPTLGAAALHVAADASCVQSACCMQVRRCCVSDHEQA